MQADSRSDNRRYWILSEGTLLVIAAPFLMFPSIIPRVSVFFIILLSVFFVLQRMLTGKRLLLQSPFSFAMGVWTATVLIGFLVSSIPALSFPRLTGLLLGFAVWRFLSDSIQTKRSLYIGTIILCLMGVIFTMVGVFSADWKYQATIVERFISTLPPQILQLPEAPAGGTHTNQVAGSMVIFLPLFLSSIIGWWRGRYRMSLLIGLIVIVFAWIALLLLTQSRSAWLAAIGGSLVVTLLWTLTTSNSSRRWIVWSVLAFTFCLIILTMVRKDIKPEEIWTEPPTETVIGSFSTLDSRKEMWRWTIAAIHDFPFTGLGLGTFRENIHRWYPFVIAQEQEIVHAHNIYLQVAYDTGLPGLTAYLAIIGIALYLTWQVARKMPDQRALAIGFSASLVTFHVFGLTDALAPGSKPGIILWMLLGLISAQWQMKTLRGVGPYKVER